MMSATEVKDGPKSKCLSWDRPRSEVFPVKAIESLDFDKIKIKYPNWGEPIFKTYPRLEKPIRNLAYELLSFEETIDFSGIKTRNLPYLNQVITLICQMLSHSTLSPFVIRKCNLSLEMKHDLIEIKKTQSKTFDLVLVGALEWMVKKLEQFDIWRLYQCFNPPSDHVEVIVV